MNEEMHKLKHLIEHWIEHNDEHVQNYIDWAKRAEKAGYPEVAKQLRAAADASSQATKLFRDAEGMFSK